MWGVVLAVGLFIALFGAVGWAMYMALEQQDYFNAEYDYYDDHEEDEHGRL